MNQYVYAFHESASFQNILITNESVLYTATTPVYYVIGTRIGMALITWEIVNVILISLKVGIGQPTKLQ